VSLNIAQFLGPDGPVARRLQGYEVRPQQIEMAEAVDRALDNRSQLLVEAGTGVGKSFAYLLPAIKRILDRNERVVVATNTISLQEQLIEKDVPLLNAVVPDEFTAVLVKGRGNYLSLRRLKLASERQDRLFPDDASRHSLHVIENWAYQTRDGTLSTLPQLERADVWDYARSDAHNCMGKKCPTFEKCFYQAARRRMENGDLLICNHALFFADLALRSRGVNMLPRYDHVILDEAHGVEDVAAEHFGLSLSESRVLHLLRMLFRPRNGKGFLASLRVDDSAHELLDRAMHDVLACYDVADAFFGDLQAWLERHPRANGQFDEARFVPDPLSERMQALGDRLALLQKKAKKEADEYELNSYSQRALDIARETRLLIGREIEDCVYWLESSTSRGYRNVRPRITVRCAPIEVAPILRESLFGQDVSVIMTSATLATAAGDFSHIRSRLGCDNAEPLQLGSPFDHASQVRLLVDRTMPEPSAADYVDQLAPRVLEHIRASEGGAFVLFTSFAMLRSLARDLREPLREAGYPLLVQGEDGPRGLLLKRFREHENSVLFGTASFWQGVDVRGRALRNVIITRLPFDVPDRPLIKARLDRIRELGGNPFMDDQVPRAVIRFKQGFGRLIRSASDSGRVVVLDPRIGTKAYGRVFRAALPRGVEACDAGIAAGE